jgi:hypothetical protein
LRLGLGQYRYDVAKDQSTEVGWRLEPLFGTDVKEVAAGVAFVRSPTPAIHGYFTDHSGLSFSRFHGTNWSTSQVISSSHVKAAHPRHVESAKSPRKDKFAIPTPMQEVVNTLLEKYRMGPAPDNLRTKSAKR